MSLDFLRIRERPAKKSKDSDPDTPAGIEIYAELRVVRSTDLMTRGKSFYAIYDEETSLWSTDEYDVVRLVDKALWDHRERRIAETGMAFHIKLMSEFDSGAWQKFQQFIKNLPDFSVQLDEKIAFANTVVKKGDYISKRLSYSIEEGTFSAWDELVSTLYDPEEREKIEWIIGAVISGDSKDIHKFGVFYGTQGSGKSTILNIIGKKLLSPYTAVFDAKALTSNSNAFATEVFRNGPLVAIQHDGDLSKIEDNSKINAIISHEPMTMNEKFKPSYEAAVLAFLLMGTNKPVKITDAKSGIIRRLIDIHPSGRLLDAKRYQAIMAQIDFELGAIADHCLKVYRERGKNFYDGYRAISMMLQTDVFYNFIEYYFDIFKGQEGISLEQAFKLYKQFIDDSEIEYSLAKYKFRDELMNYFEKYEDRATIDGQRVRSWYSGFKIDKFKSATHAEDAEEVVSLVMDSTESIFDEMMAEQPAQYAKKDESPANYWDQVTTTLEELDRTKLHYVRIPENHIIIDFDLADEGGHKSLELNLDAASKWPPTYAEFSKSGAGIHLHYNYVGDVHELSRVFGPGIEVKVLTGKQSLRRKLSKCNNIPVATLHRGYLPLTEKKMIRSTQVKSEAKLRDLLEMNFQKKVHPGTKPSVDFMHKILSDAYADGLVYDVTDLRPRMIAFANGSTHQPLAAIQKAMSMPYKSEGSDIVEQVDEFIPDDDRLAFYDIECYPNLFHISWRYIDSDVMVHLTNPSAAEVEQFLRLKLVGFNNRRYDNHMVYAASMGWNNDQLYRLSQKLISGETSAYFGAAYGLCWADIYDYSTTKQSLKKWEVELGIKHMEMDIPWDQPVKDEDIPRIIEYCDNDVNAEVEVHKYLSADYDARLILADLSGLSVSSTTAQHMARLIFGQDRNPQSKFVYTTLGEDTLDDKGEVVEEALFPGYKYERGKSTYRGVDVGEGGLVYAEEGMYTDVGLYDVASMHPNSILQLNLFGDEYTKNFADIIDARIAIKRKQFARARKLYDGRLAPYLTDESTADKLAYALKIAINTVYGLTAATFPNIFKDPRNKDNIVAKRGALFMVDLMNAVQEQGWTVAHIKTDSIKIPNATPEMWEFVRDFGAKYGYEFEHEATYDRLCLTTKADYVALKDGKWSATGATFQKPFVFKTLFSHEPITFEDMQETKAVQTKMYLDFTEGREGEEVEEKDLRFIGKVGVFTPVIEGAGGGVLVREGSGAKSDTFSAVTGTKDRRWMESQVIEHLPNRDEIIDMDFFRKQVDDAYKTIAKFGDVEWFVAA